MDWMTRFWFGEIIDDTASCIRGHITLSELLYSHFTLVWLIVYVILTPILIVSTAVLTHHERALMADIQFRKGPRKQGAGGLTQPFADAFKLLAKEFVSPRYLQEKVFEIAAFSSFLIAGFFWIVVPLAAEVIVTNNDFSMLVMFITSIMHIYAIILAGWASYSKYANLSSLRTTAQLVSYEICIGIVYSLLYSFVKDMNIVSYVESQFTVGCFSYFLPILGIIFFISSLAELSRHPFDLPEAEAESVSGYSVEYSAIRFALFFLAEYLNIIFYANFSNDLFFGQGSNNIYFYYLRIIIIIYAIIKIRGVIPRYRYDHLMSINWKIFIPILSSFIFYFMYIQHFIF